MKKEELQLKVKTLIDNDMLLPRENVIMMREKFDELSIGQLQQMIPILEEVAQQQKTSLEKKLKEEPYFFKNLEAIIAREEFVKHVKIESKEKEKLEKNLSEELADL